MKVYTCSHLDKAMPNWPDCCESCHEDDERFGYALLEYSPEDRADELLIVCCRSSHEIQRRVDPVELWKALRGAPKP